MRRYWPMVLAAAVVVSGVALLQSKFEAATAGQIGDTFSGLSAFVALLVVAGSAVYAFEEVHRARAQHAFEVRADVARFVWRSAFSLGRDLIDLLKAIEKSRIGLAPPWSLDAEKDRVERAFQDYRAALADANLYLTSEVESPLHELGVFRKRVLALVDSSIPVSLIPSASKDDILHDGAGDIAATLDRLRSVLLSFALSEQPLNSQKTAARESASDHSRS